MTQSLISISTNQLLPNEVWAHILSLSHPDVVCVFRFLDRNARALVDEKSLKFMKLVQRIHYVLGDDFFKDFVGAAGVKYYLEKIRRWDYKTLYRTMTRFQEEELQCVLPLTEKWEYKLDVIETKKPALKFYQIDQRIRNINLIQFILNAQTNTVCRKQSLRCVLGLNLAAGDQTLRSVAKRIRELMREGKRTQNPRFTMLFVIYANRLGMTRVPEEVCCLEEVRRIEFNDNHVWRISSEISQNSSLRKLFFLNNPLYALSGKHLLDSKVIWRLSQGYCDRLHLTDKQALDIREVYACGVKSLMVVSKSQFQRTLDKASRFAFSAFLSVCRS